jgi:hypothetical protein
MAWERETHTTVISTSTLRPDFDYEVPYTTLCDGYRRAAVSRLTTQTVTYDPATTEYVNFYEGPAPTCTIPEPACTAIISAYVSSRSDYLNNESPSPMPTHCTTYRPCDSHCRINNYGRAATVWYWPVTTTSGDFCTASGKTILAEPTSPPNPNTVVSDGYTFVSPTNYISFESLDAGSKTRKYYPRTNCGTAEYTNVIVPVTGAMTTKGFDGTKSSLNFEDLNTMKFEDFKAQRWCRNNDCTVIEGIYTPELALPTEVEPKEWRDAGCKGTDVGTSYYHPTMVPLVTPAPVAKGKLL